MEIKVLKREKESLVLETINEMEEDEDEYNKKKKKNNQDRQKVIFN